MMDRDMPKRCWLSSESLDFEHEVWFDPDEGGTEYVRADFVATLRARLEKAEAERDQLAEQQIAAVNDLQTARDDALEDAVNAIWALDLSEVDPMDEDANREAFEMSIQDLKSKS